jgi:DNA-binding transcriptional ArsR family regulator
MKDVSEAHISGVSVPELLTELRAKAIPAAAVTSGGTAQEGASPTIEAQLRLKVFMLEWEIKALLNPYLRQEAPVIVQVLKEAQRLAKLGKSDDEGWACVPYQRIAKRLKTSRNTVQRHVAKAAKAGLLEKINKREWSTYTDKLTGQIIQQPVTKAYFRLVMSLPDHLALIAEYEPDAGEKRGWGGKRVRCPEHPTANIIRGEFCAECGELLKATELDGDGHSALIYRVDPEYQFGDD